MSADNVHATKGERMYDTGSTTFMLICTMLVFLMTPGLAFFYGGLSRRKNVINTMLMCFGAIGLVGVLWIVAGWSLAYGGDGSSPFIGGFDQLLCLPVLNQVLQAAEGNAADGAVYPQIINIAFQMAFAMITAAIVTGSLAGRVKFGAMTAFLAFGCSWSMRRSPTWFGAAMVPLSATSSARSTLPAATWYTFRPVSRA